MTNTPRNPHPNDDAAVLAEVATVLDDLGPFTLGMQRQDMWRTTEQLARAVFDRFGRLVQLDDLNLLLQRHEAAARARLSGCNAPNALIRRATYPDRTTALPLWGSTKHRGQPWSNQPEAERTDPPGDVPLSLRVNGSAPRIFLSHAQRDAPVAVHVAERLATIGIGTWMFETDIEQRWNIAACVREAIAAAAGCTALMTRDSIASLWVLTELHTALQNGKPIWLILDTTDALMVQLLASLAYHHPDQMFDTSVTCDCVVLDRLRADYAQRHSASRAARYIQQAHDFLASIPLYLSGQPALAYPDVPDGWSGPVALARLENLAGRIAVPAR